MEVDDGKPLRGAPAAVGFRDAFDEAGEPAAAEVAGHLAPDSLRLPRFPATHRAASREAPA